MSLGGHIALCKASALYLGSAVPIETAVGLEAFQMPCRERYWSALDSNMKVDGIDATATVYSSGLLMQYTGDQGSITWFPVQSLHACAAVKASSGGIDGRPRFVALDSMEGTASHHPPLFCAIMRRTRGIKVLECHVFICKSTEAAMTMVQAMTHAFEHREGWLSDDAVPPGASADSMYFGGGGVGTRIVAADRGVTSSSNWNGALVQKFAINTSCPQPPPPAQPAPPPPAPAPAPPAPAPVCPAPAPTPAPVIQVVPVPVQNQYFANWDQCGGQALMFMPESPFYPGPEYKQKKHKKKKKSKKKEEDDEEEEIYVMKKPASKHHEEVEYYQQGTMSKSRDYRQVPDDLVIYAPSQQTTRYNDYVLQQDPGPAGLQDYNFYSGGAADLTQQQYAMDQQTAESYAAAQYEAELQAADQYNAALEYNRALASGAYEPEMDPGYGYPDPGYPAPYGYPQAPMVNAYGELVDGLGYYP